MSEQAVNEVLTELFEDVENVLSRRTNQIIRTIGESRLAISDFLAGYVENGSIPTSKIPQIMRDLDEIEAQMYRNIRDDLRSVVKDIAEQSTTSISEAVIGAIGTGALLSFIGITSVNVLTNEAIFSALTGLGVIGFITSIVTSVFNRKGDDDKTLNDRIRSLARLLTNEIRNTLRATIGRGEDNAVIIRELNRVIDENDWRVRTIVETESLYATRQSVAKFAETSEIVKGLRIVDFPQGHEHARGDREHDHHQCFIYAHVDAHGLGEGVYPVTTRKIRNPHPQCRAQLQYVLIDEFQ